MHDEDDAERSPEDGQRPRERRCHGAQAERPREHVPGQEHRGGRGREPQVQADAVTRQEP